MRLARYRSLWDLSAALGLALALASTGCATWHMHVSLRGDAETNGGRPLQVLVRTLSLQEYRGEPYTALAQLFTQPDKSVVRTLTIEPRGRFSRSFWLSVPSDQPVALYFLFTSQTGSWKMLLQPRLPWRVRVPLGRRGVDVEAVSECRFLRDL